MPRILVAYLKEEKIEPYLAALRSCGVAETDLVRATPARLRGVDLEELVATSDGLLLTGGADLQPCLYGEARRPDAGLDDPAPERDQLEWDLLWHARLTSRPVFGICRGHQMLNVFLGGALIQDLPSQTGQSGHAAYADLGFALDHLAHRVVATASAHPLARWIGEFDRPLVNSRHHQAVRRPGEGLEVIAFAEDGVVEATAAPEENGWWRQSVQWHPENLVHLPFHRGLFASFLTAVAGRSAARASVGAGA